MEAVYRNDAYRLATKRVNDINSTWKDSVMIPEIYIDSIAKALYAMQNMEPSLVKDTIQTKFGSPTFSNYYYPADSSHTFTAGGDWNYAYRIKNIRITILNAASWAANWESGNFNNTTSDTINYLVNRYGLQVIPNSMQFYPDKKIYLVSSPAALNMPALKNQFQQISGVVYSELESNVPGSNYIGADIINGDVLLTYNVGCGDCISGCTFGRQWNFKVNTSTDCSVNYISANYWGIILVMPEIFDFSSCFGPVVPIELTGIKVSQKNNYQLVEWQMAMEENVARYVIERSDNGINYLSIGKIELTGNSSGPVNYSWKDVDLVSGNIYYRIKIVDRSGAIKYSPVAFINIKSKAGITISPTLVSNNYINIQFNKVDKGIYFIDLLNNMGQKIFSAEMNANTETFSKQLKIPASLSSGVYVFSIRGKTMQANQRIFISGL
jgi:hypothetical protein